MCREDDGREFRAVFLVILRFGNAGWGRLRSGCTCGVGLTW
jgi:hypothetical protein